MPDENNQLKVCPPQFNIQFVPQPGQPPILGQAKTYPQDHNWRFKGQNSEWEVEVETPSGTKEIEVINASVFYCVRCLSELVKGNDRLNFTSHWAYPEAEPTGPTLVLPGE